MRAFCSWLAGILFLGCLALGWLLWRQQQGFQRAASVRAASDQKSMGATAELHRQIAAAKQAQAAAEKKAASLAAAGRSTTVYFNTAGRINFKQVRLSEVAKEFPGFPAIYARQQLRNIIMNYGEAVAQLDLPADKKAKLLQLLSDRQSTQSDFWITSQAAGLEANSPEGQKAMQAAVADVDEQIGALVNQDGKTFMNQLQGSLGPQMMVRFNYAPGFEDAGVPLTPDQSTALARALGAPSGPGQKGGADPVDPNNPLPAYQQRMVARASSVLSPAQLQVFQGEMQDQATSQRIYAQYMKGGGTFSIEP